MTIKAVVFDAYGTLFDVYSIQALAEQSYPGQGAAISVMWRDKQIEYVVGILAEQAAEAFEWWRGVRPNTAAVIQQSTVPLVCLSVRRCV